MPSIPGAGGPTCGVRATTPWGCEGGRVPGGWVPGGWVPGGWAGGAAG